MVEMLNATAAVELENAKWVYFPRSRFEDCVVAELDNDEWLFKREDVITKGPFFEILEECFVYIYKVSEKLF